jgi:NAD(P)H dehydrogenase (quinone)
MIVMTGANGRLGRAIAKALARRGAAPRVTLLSRDPSKLADLAALGFKTGRADFADPASLPTAFAGATTALISSVPGPIPERIPLHRNAFDAAQQAHVGRLIYTSRVNPAADSLYPFAEIHAFSEGYLKTTGLPTTIVRNNEYMENITKIVSGAKDPGKLLLPGATGGVAYIALTDIA